MSNDNTENRLFEHEVRKVAEAIWGLMPGECQPEFYATDTKVKELDGLARLRDVSHLIMVTVSRRLDKTKQDVKKLNAAEKIERTKGVAIQKWLITKYQLEAEHVRHCRENNVSTMPLGDFRRRFFDGRAYLAKRRNAAFGSARNPNDNSITIPDDEYLELPLRVVSTQSGLATHTEYWTLSNVCERIVSGETVVLVGPFGAGKSLTVREVFFRLTDSYIRETLKLAPIAICLRDHWGSKYADEILERHAREIGFTPREDLLVAWRAGLGCLLIDGFDEVAAQVVVSHSNKNFMREARSQALGATRDLIKNSPAGCGCIITGRNHYFDTDREMVHALGLSQRSYTVVELEEFAEGQAEAYVRRKGSNAALPDWLPRKPLILAYLAQRGLLKDVLAIESSQGFAYAWDKFLDLICEREAAYGAGVMDPGTLRGLLERLAWDVRSTASGTGPIAERELAESYLAETGQNAGEGVLMQLQRLPGLTPRDQDLGSRAFVDADMLAALQGSALSRCILEGRSAGSGRESVHALPKRAVEMTAYLLRQSGAEVPTVIAAGMRAAERRSGSDQQLAADCVVAAISMSEEDKVDCLGIAIHDSLFRVLSLEDKCIERLRLDNCWIDEVCLGQSTLESSIVLANCAIVRILGAAEVSSLPKKIFQNCEIDEFEPLSTNSAIVNSDLPARLKALLTVLRKLYLQAGGGRRIAALKRGLPPGDISECIDDVVRTLERVGLVSIYNDIAHPVRRHAARAQAIISARVLSDDPIVRDMLAHL